MGNGFEKTFLQKTFLKKEDIQMINKNIGRSFSYCKLFYNVGKLFIKNFPEIKGAFFIRQYFVI